MTKKPELIKISETEYHCSRGDLKISMNTARPQPPTEAEWKRLREQQFAEHVRQVHSREDVNQTAARIVREATKD